MNRLLTAVIIYLLSDSFGSSIWAYLGLYTDPRDSNRAADRASGRLRAIRRLPLPVPPRSFVEQTSNTM
jgi:hypothetical protein